MAYSQTDLDNIDKAIATGYLTVRYADGRTVTFRSVSELKEARALILKTLNSQSKPKRPRSFILRTNKGL